MAVCSFERKSKCRTRTQALASSIGVVVKSRVERKADGVLLQDRGLHVVVVA